MVTSKPSSTNCPNFSLVQAYACCEVFPACEFGTFAWLMIIRFVFQYVTIIQVAIALGFHLFPFRTEQLSPAAPMVLRKWESRSPPSFKEKELQVTHLKLFFLSTCAVPWPCFSSAPRNGASGRAGILIEPKQLFCNIISLFYFCTKKIIYIRL